MNLVWHYAPWATLPQIVAAGALLPGEPGRDGEAPLLWFSARQDWEPTATRHVMDGGRPRPMTFLEHRQRLGCVRFGLPADDTRLLPWMDACRAAHMRFTDRRKLEASSRRVGANPLEWSASMEAIALAGLRFQVLAETWGEDDMSACARLWTQRRG